MIVKGRGVSLAIISMSVKKVKYTLFLFSRITVSPSLRLREFAGVLHRKCPYFINCFSRSFAPTAKD